MQGTQFDFSFAPGTTQQQMIGFEMAGELWSQYLNDDVVVNIHVQMTNTLPDNVIGGALPGLKKGVEYKKVWKALEEDRDTSYWWEKNTNDEIALDSLSKTNEFSALVGGTKTNKLKYMKLTNANLKALEPLKDQQKLFEKEIEKLDRGKNDLDGFILMSDLNKQNNAKWNYDSARKGDIRSNELDFLSVAVHEVGHILGFTSGLDDSDWLNSVSKAGKELHKGKFKGEEIKLATPLDLFRYSSNGNRDLSIGQDSYFSVDGGHTPLAEFSTSEFQSMGGDGYQASHWKNNGTDVMGIMDPALKRGMRRDISSLDCIAMDVTGWDVVNPGQLNWKSMYSDAVRSANSAYVSDRNKDLVDMIANSNRYHGRAGGGHGNRDGERNAVSLSQLKKDKIYNVIAFSQHFEFQTLDDATVELQPTIIPTEVFTIVDNSAASFSTPTFVDLSAEDSDFDSGYLEVVATDAVNLEINNDTATSTTQNIDLFAIARLTNENMEDMGNLL